MIDGGFLRHVLYRPLGNRLPAASDVISFSKKCLRDDDERLFRIYFYDCRPYDGRETNPISGEEIDFSATRIARTMTGFLDDLSRRDHIAFRRGVLQFNGWKLKEKSLDDMTEGEAYPLGITVALPAMNGSRSRQRSNMVDVLQITRVALRSTSRSSQASQRSRLGKPRFRKGLSLHGSRKSATQGIFVRR